MNEITLVRDAGPEGPPLSYAARSAARAALLAEIEASTTVRGRVRARPPRRRTAVRLGAVLAAVAAAWTAAVVIAAPDPIGQPAHSVTLVDFRMPTFPLSLDPEPAGLRPAFDGDGDGASIADYRDADGRNGFTIFVGEDEPDLEERNQGATTESVEEVRIGDRDAVLVRGSREVGCGDGFSVCGTQGFTQVAWEFRDDMWVLIEGEGVYRDVDRLRSVAESLVDRPQPVTLSVGLAPAGWSVQFYKMGRVLTLVNDAYEQQTINVHIPLPEDVIPPDRVRSSIMGPVGPQLDVTVHGRPAQLVLCDSGYLDQRIWYLQAQFENGTTFVLQVPDAFTREQVLQFAGQVTYIP
jgi:hypothetical protein